MNPPSPRVDRYGFIISDAKGKDISEQEKKQAEKDEEEEQQKELIWQSLLKKWDSYMKNKRNYVAEMVKKGTPDSMRGVAWAKILEIDSLPSDVDYQELHRRTDDLPFKEYVLKDIDRSLPQIAGFREKEILEKFKNVLFAYGYYDQKIGYVQGMNFICGILVHYQEEEVAFKSFVQIMNGPRVMHHEYFARGFPRMSVANNMLKQIISEKYPKIIQNFEENDIVFELFTSGWFLTAFMAFNWPPEFQMRIFERFLFFGTRGILGLAVAIFSRHKDILSDGKSMVEILPVLQKPDESPKMKDWHYVIKKWDEHWVKKSEYLKLLKNAGAPPEPML